MEDFSLFLKFGKYNRIQALLETGELFAQPLAFYKEMEHDEIGDRYEGTVSLKSYDDGILKVKDRETGQFLKVADITSAQLRENNTALSTVNVFCLYSLKFNEDGPKNIGSKLSPKLDKGFGNSVLLIYNIPEFLTRIKAACESLGFSTMQGHVEYLPLREHSGNVGPFRKDLKFQHQSEFRVAIVDPKRAGKPLRLNIGPLTDIATMMEATAAKSLMFEITND